MSEYVSYAAMSGNHRKRAEALLEAATSNMDREALQVFATMAVAHAILALHAAYVERV